ncbi:MAG: sensor histidine kinase [Acidimicrobiales bacterium]
MGGSERAQRAGRTERSVPGAEVEGVFDAASRDRFLALLAHELRTPITIIGGWVQTLQDHELEPAVVERALTSVNTQVRRLERLSSDILEAAAVSMGQHPLRLLRTDLVAIARQTVAATAAGPPDTAIPISGPASAPIVADPERIGQVLLQLLENGRQHGDAGSVRVEIDRDGDDVELRVQSTGDPIPSDLAREVFEPFTRGPASPGRGLGLYVARALVVAHGGRIGFESEGGVTTFWVRLASPARS